MSIEKRYLPNQKTTILDFDNQSSDYIMDRKEHIERIRAKCQQFQAANFSSAALSEEQERELAPEAEQERQAERPKIMKPREHTIHPDVLQLVQRGSLNPNGGGFLAAFGSFNRSTAVCMANVNEFGQDLLVTTDFAGTVYLPPGSHSDTFHRAVQWILTFRNRAASDRPTLVVLSPWEVNELVLEVEKSNHVHLHQYAARPNVSFPTLQDLRLYTTPTLPAAWMPPSKYLILQLNIFSGQLYFEDLNEYNEVCAFLGLSCVPNDGTITAGVDGFVGRGIIYPECRFTQSPTAFLRVIMSNIRRDCQDISRTHVGRMLAGEILTEKDFLAAEN